MKKTALGPVEGLPTRVQCSWSESFRRTSGLLS